MKLKHTLIAAAACAFVASGAALAQPMEGHHHGGGEGMEILHALNLTDGQKAQVHDAEKAAWSQAKPIMAEMHAVHDQMATALTVAGPVTAEQLAPMVQKEEQLRGQLDQIHLATVLQVRSVLTPEQIAQAASLHQKLAALHSQEHEILSGQE